jgi:hypothetical protein
MPNWNRSGWVVCAVVATAAYFSVALWLKYSYESPKPAGTIIRLSRPYFQSHDSNIAFVVNVPSLDHLSDTVEFQARSPFILYENELPLGPAHSEHAEIAKYGHGRFSHWNGAGFIFSSSDGTSPKSNGRTYWAVIPPSPAD